MAEIKSTMDLVMARAASIGKATSDELRHEEARRQGVKITVEYLEGSLDGLEKAIAARDREEQPGIRLGIGETLLRNLFLPRDEVQQAKAERAVQGIFELGGKAGDLEALCREMQSVVAGYRKHREQLMAQLQEQIRMQYEQLLQRQAGMPAGAGIEQTLQAKIQEEWGRIEKELDRQYTVPLEQLKTRIKERLGI
jgi:hypothetical protein